MSKSGSVHGYPDASFTCAAGAFSDKGLAAKVSAKNTVAPATAVSDEVIGIVKATPDSSQTHIAIVTAGFVMAKLGDTVTIGQELTVDSSGRLVPVSADTDLVCAVAQEGGAVNEYIEVFVIPAAVRSTVGVKVASVTLTAAQMKALNATPQVLVADPGDGYVTEVLSIIGIVNYNSAAYATTTTVEFRYTNGSGTKVTADMAALIDATADKIVRVGGIEAELVLTDSAPVVAYAPTADPTAGDSPVTFITLYRTIATGL